MVSSLPPVTWFAIADHLPRSGKLRIFQVSHQLCAVARRTIYCNVGLRSDNGAAQAILALLARIVKRLHINTAEKAAKGPTGFNADALAGMTNLHTELDHNTLPYGGRPGQVQQHRVRITPRATEAQIPRPPFRRG